MRIILIILSLTLVQPDSLSFLFWNLENFFDPRPDSTSASELAFSAFGERHWSRKRYDRKVGMVGKTILWSAARYGSQPAIMGFAELEKKRVLTDLVRHTALRKQNYSVVHFDSPDPRGIDVGLIYRKKLLTLLRAGPVHVYDSAGAVLPTRDILLAEFGLPDGDSLAVMVCHFPSKFGGVSASAPKRNAAVRRLENVTDSLSAKGFRRIVAMGDFNDTPEHVSPRGLVNAALPLWKGGRGTIRYEGTWELIDMFFISPDLSGSVRMEIAEPPFLLAEDRKYGGKKPLRTYSGPRYLGGVSDHFPILLLPGK